MKKLFSALCGLIIVFGVWGNAHAISFTNINWIFKTLSGTGSISWTHDTPDDFAVPPDTVYSASLTVSSAFADVLNDIVTIEETIKMALPQFGIWGTSVPIGEVFVSWDEGDTLDITLNYSELGTNWLGVPNSLLLIGSRFDLVYENGNDGIPRLAGASSPVPEPATMLLFGVGLIGIAAFGRSYLFRPEQGLPNPLD